MKTIVLLAMHGSPPLDFPRLQLQEFLALHTRFGHMGDLAGEVLKQRHDELETKIRDWPRTAANDPYHAGSLEIAEKLGKASGHTVIVGFNEFCAPSLDDAFDRAAKQGAKKIIVVTPMMTRGGEHSEKDIPACVARAKDRHPGIQISYAWPFSAEDVAGFLANQLKRF